MNKNLHPKTRMSLLLTVLMLGILGIVIFIIIPTTREIQEIQKNVLIEQRDLEERYQRGLLLRRLRDDWGKISKDVETIENAVLSYSKGVPFITRLETLAAEQNINHRLTLPFPEQNEERGDVRVPFELHWQGAWVPILKMLATLEREPFYLPIETMRITSLRAAVAAPTSFSHSSPSSLQPPNIEEDINMVLTGTTLWRNE